MRFPQLRVARLDRDVVEGQFAELADSIAAETGRTLTPIEVAEGFLRIAVDNMANAIKTVTSTTSTVCLRLMTLTPFAHAPENTRLK